LTDDKDAAGKLLRVRLIQKEGNSLYKPYYLLDESIEMKSDSPGIVFKNYKEDWYGTPASVVELDGEFKDISELLDFEKKVGNLPVTEFGELTKQMS